MRRQALLVLTIFVACAGGCDSRGKMNHFVVPDGYKGPVALVSDPRFQSDSYWDGEQYVHTVPQTAVVCLQSDEVIRPTFRLTAAYANGDRIYSNFQGLPNPPESESVRIAAFGSWGSSSEDGYLHWLGVGNEAEIMVLQGRFFGAGDAIELAMPTGVKIDRLTSNDFLYLSQYCSRQ